MALPIPRLEPVIKIVLFIEELAKPNKASGISGQDGQKKKITCPV
jgi:hypothetical protein